jgi:hypothetical protein
LIVDVVVADVVAGDVVAVVVVVVVGVGAVVVVAVVVVVDVVVVVVDVVDDFVDNFLVHAEKVDKLINVGLMSALGYFQLPLSMLLLAALLMVTSMFEVIDKLYFERTELAHFLLYPDDDIVDNIASFELQ